MYDVQIFKSPEFGDIRTVIIDGEPWFVSKDISDKLGYAKPANMIKLVDEDDKRNLRGSDLEPGSKAQISAVNESGLYAAIFGSKQENAKKFKKRVTSEVLPSIRKTGGYGVPQTIPEQIQLLAQGNVELNKRVDDIQAEVEALKMDLPLFPSESEKISNAVKKKGVEVLGGKQSNAYKDKSLQHKVYTNIYANLKYNFEVSSYKSIKRGNRHEALKIVEEYKPPYFLAEQITNVNAQRNLDLKGGTQK